MVGRFINADDTAILQATQEELLGGNLFAYCVNNPVVYSDPSGYSVIKSAPICPSGVIAAIKLLNWNNRFNLRFFSSMRSSGIYEIYSFTYADSLYHYYIYNVWVRVDSFVGWMKYLSKKYGWVANLQAEIEYGLGILSSVSTIPTYISSPADVISYILGKLPNYAPKEERYILKILQNYKSNSNSIYIAFSLDIISVSARKAYWLWGPIVGWSNYYFNNYLTAY